VQAHQAVDLTSLITSCAERAVVAAPAHAWRVDVAPGLLVVGDEELLRRAVDNLITNVRVHTPDGTTAVISAAGSSQQPGDVPAGSRVVIAVSDDGPGVPGDQLPHIFERFYRGGAASRPGSGLGSGLGLAIVSEIAVAHGGCAVATSDDGAGLRVTLDLPQLACPAGGWPAGGLDAARQPGGPGDSGITLNGP
jgi:signal transduction histidine kinase